ncbi:TPA: CDP-alcohol phosphatidyltransferase family protein [Candidatus Bathyarchaeota archaeon]|nr:CDP-alcohol phosphatidyltransferase family protein [Candidatus Bathyarchaeota archaeon]
MRILVKSSIAWTLTALRLAVLPFLAYTFSIENSIATSLLFLFAISTDLLDGYVARRLNVQSTQGVYFDAIVDYIFISGMFFVFINHGFYPAWLLVLIGLVFLQFLLTSVFLKSLFDPVGKYYGSLLFGAVGLTLLFSGSQFYGLITLCIVFVTSLSLISRIAYLFYFHSKSRKTEQGEV